MFHFLFKETISGIRGWLGVVFPAIVATAFLSAEFTVWTTLLFPVADSGRLPAALIEELKFGLGVVIVTTLVPCIAVLSSVASCVVAEQWNRYARWRVIGASQAMIQLAVIGQIFLFVVLGGALGLAISLPFLPAAGQLLLELVRATEYTLRPSLDPASVGVILLVLLVASGIGGVPAALKASRSPVVPLLRGDSPPPLREKWRRWVGLATGLALGGYVCSGLIGVLFLLIAQPEAHDPALYTVIAMIVGLGTIAFMAGLGSFITPVAVRLWTRLLPGQHRATWLLAKHRTLTRLAESTSSVTSLYVAFSLVGVILGTTHTLGASAARISGATEVNLLDTYVMLTPGVLTAGAGALSIVYITGRSRERELALFRTAGANVRQLFLVVFLEAFIAVLTSAMMAFVTIASTLLLQVLLFARLRSAVLPRFDWQISLPLFLLLLIGVWLASAIPSFISSRRPVTRFFTDQ